MHQLRTLNFSNILRTLVSSLTLAFCTMTCASAQTLVFSYPNGFSGATGMRAAYESQITGGVLQLTSGATGHQAGGVWTTSQQDIQTFTTTFKFQLTAPVKPSIQGITFVVQNSNSTTNPGTGGGANSTGDANLLGFFGYSNPSTTAVANSVAVKFDLNPYNNQSYSSSVPPNTTGLYINGGPEGVALAANDLNAYGINLYSGHVFSCTIVYDGSLWTMTLLDTITNVQARYTWPVNVPAATKGNLAYIGFTGGQVESGAYQNILSWSFWRGYATRLATPRFTLTPGQYQSTQTVSISGPAGATIYYTTNGLLPTSSSQKYTGPITVSSSEIINAVAIQSGYTDSLVATGNYLIAPSGSPVINFPSGFASAKDLIKLVGYPYFSGSSIQMTDTAGTGGQWHNSGFELGAAWYAAPVSVTNFTTNFNLQFTNSGASGHDGVGMMFCIQNQPAPSASPPQFSYVSGGPLTIGNGMDSLGYGPAAGEANMGTTGGILSSVALKFDLTNNSTGLYTNGASPTNSGGQVSITGVTLSSGNPLAVSLSYNGTVLTMTIMDTVTRGTFSHSWTINIPGTVGGTTAYIGFTAATNYWWANQNILSWTYSASGGTAVPAAPTNLKVQ
jgi:Legume lectin domain/Chitobiase/beta-hexosaminidase C-terminal domain